MCRSFTGISKKVTAVKAGDCLVRDDTLFEERVVKVSSVIHSYSYTELNLSTGEMLKFNNDKIVTIV